MRKRKMVMLIMLILVSVLISSCGDSNDGDNTIGKLELNQRQKMIKELSSEDKIMEQNKELDRKIAEYINEYTGNMESVRRSKSENKITEAIGYLKDEKEHLNITLKDINDQDWCKTGNIEYDGECKVVKQRLYNYYSSQLEDIAAYEVWLQDLESLDKEDSYLKAVERTMNSSSTFLTTYENFLKKYPTER